jgi:type I restriction enzyme S subunit
MKWPSATLESIKAEARYSLVGGPFGSELTTRDYAEDGVPVIRGSNLPDDRCFDGSEFVFVREEKAEQLFANNAHPGDVIFTQRGTLGQVGLIPVEAPFSRYLISQSQMKLSVNPTKADAKFVYYYFRHPDTVQNIKNHAITSGVPHINLGLLRALKIPLPPLGAQREIVSILSAYDDLIENNRRRMALLEKAARLLYEEWFVRLRFPGHERAEIVTSSLGRIARSWEIPKLGDITTKIGSGATPRGGEASYETEGTVLIRSQNVYNDRFEDDGLAHINDKQADELESVSVESRDILLNITGASVARCCMVPRRHLPARVNQHVMIVRVDPALADPYFVHSAINSDGRKRQLLSYARAGGTREALTKDHVANFQIVIPDTDLLREFGRIAGEIHQQLDVLAEQDVALRNARDMLLPRLMNGQIAV